MSAIAVNTKALSDVTQGTKNYCSYQNDQMRQADSAVKAMLSSDWLGDDAKEFDQKWAGVCDKGSEAAKLRDSLLAFGELLADCIAEYRAAQETAINEGVTLRGKIPSLI